jgi:hypothetical protein
MTEKIQDIPNGRVLCFDVLLNGIHKDGLLVGWIGRIIRKCFLNCMG